MCQHSTQKKPLLTIKEVPRFLRYNYYIRTGYRHTPEKPTSTAYHVLQSIFSWHNESVNIWTHTFGLLIFIYLIIYEVLLRTDYIRWYVIMVCCACINVYFGSIMYHSTMNTCRCQHDYYHCLNYDVLGVIIVFTFTGVPAIANGYKCNYWLIIVCALIILFGCTYWCCVHVFQPHVTPTIRAKYIGTHLTLSMCLGLCMILPNCVYHGRCESVKWRIISFSLLLIGGIINVLRYPEKLFASKYVSSFFLSDRNALKQEIKNGEKILDAIRCWIDYIGNSHQIMHVFVFLGSIVAYWGCVWDDLYAQNTVCNGDNADWNSYNNIAQTHAFAMTNEEMSVVAMTFVFDPSFLYPF